MGRKAQGLSGYEFEEYVCPNGNEMYLPSIMEFSICSVCRVPVLAPDANEVSVAGANRYLDRQWFRWRGGFINERPMCTTCLSEWRLGWVK